MTNGGIRVGMRKRNEVFKSFLLGMSMMLLVSFPAAAADTEDADLKKRVEQLEQLIKAQQAQMEKNEKLLQELKHEIATRQQETAEKTEAGLKEVFDKLRLDSREPTPEEKRVETIYDDGFFLKGEDDTLKIGGWYQFDGRLYPESGHPEASTFTNRRVRLDFRGTLEHHWGYRLYATLVGSPVVQEAWLENHHFPFARLKLGQFKEPFSLESQYSARWIDFVERSIGVTALQPAEDVGAMLFGTFADGRAVYGIGAFNGQGRSQDAVVDDKDVTGRLVIQPFRLQKDSPFKDLYIGGSLGVGNNERNFANRDFVTAGQTPFFDFAGNARFDGGLFRYGAELEWLKGPYKFSTEWIGTRFDKIIAGSNENELTANGWYATLSYVLTGENAVRNAQLVPARPFDFKNGGWGAWQILGRFERFWVEEDEILLKRIATGTDGVNAYSLGLNWYPNRHLKFMINFVHAEFDDEITPGTTTEPMDDEDVILMRGQFNY